jgi:carbamoyltransferase
LDFVRLPSPLIQIAYQEWWPNLIILSYYSGHDPAVTIIRDGEILLNLERERHSRLRHDFGMTKPFLDHCLEMAGVNIAEVDLVVTQRGDLADIDKSVCTPLYGESFEFGYRTTSQLARRRIDTIRVHHHLAHVASAFFTSPFRDSVLLSWDGMGDNVNTSIGVARDGRISWWKPFRSANVATWFRGVGLKNFGMRPTNPSDIGSQAGKIMALAAYGESDPEMSRKLEGEIALFHHLFHDQDGPTRERPGFNLSEDLSDSRSPRAQALARALQDIAESYLDQLMDRAFTIGEGIGNLCFVGGVALNCVANTRAFNQSGFDSIYVPPCSNDGGLALGQALFASHYTLKQPFTPSHFSPYLGPMYSTERIDQAVREANLDDALVTVHEADADQLLQHLVAGEIIALYRGRSETGPRALGHRSIICRPDAPNMRDRLNLEVKQREWYRPFAPIVLADWSDRVFETPFPHSPYMATTAKIRPEWQGRLAAVRHVDGTTRPQVLKPEHEPWLHDLISRFHEATGIPAIVNTSFNKREPIVETPEEAIRTFLDMPIRYLYLEDRLLEKANPNGVGDG